MSTSKSIFCLRPTFQYYTFQLALDIKVSSCSGTRSRRNTFNDCYHQYYHNFCAIITMSRTFHDSRPDAICLCPTCVDDINNFISCLTNLEQAQAVTHHILEKHQSQLIQIAALKTVLEDKDPIINLLRQQIDMLQEHIREYQQESNPSCLYRMPGSMSGFEIGGGTTQAYEDAMEQVVRLKQKLRSARTGEHPHAMRLKVAANQFAANAAQKTAEVQAENAEVLALAKEWRCKVQELEHYEQFVVDSQIWREMHEAEGCGTESRWEGCQSMVC
jgi:cob(I)alamin adenosyltransferase